MRAVNHALLDGLVLPPGWIVEVGCGAGAFAADLAGRYPGHGVVGVELNPLALGALAAEPLDHPRLAFLQGDGHHLPMPDGACRLVVALDVLDQQGLDPVRALAEWRRVLTPGGWLLLRVSAYAWLHGPHDDAFGTARRYRAADLRRLLEEAGLTVVRLSHANALLLPEIAVARFLQQWGLLSVQAELHMPERLSQALAACLRGEARWLRSHNLAIGSSIYAIAQRRE